MISYSVSRYLPNYTNTTIADIAGNTVAILPETPSECRCRLTEQASTDVAASRANIITSNGECFMLFRNVLSVSWCIMSLMMFHNVLQVFHGVSLCFTMFYDVLWVSKWSASASIGIGASNRHISDHVPTIIAITPQHAGIGDNAAEIGKNAAGIGNITELLNSILNGDWSNSVSGRHFPMGAVAPLEVVFQEQSCSSLHSWRSLAWDPLSGDITDPCGVNTDFCKVNTDPCGYRRSLWLSPIPVPLSWYLRRSAAAQSPLPIVEWLTKHRKTMLNIVKHHETYKTLWKT